VADRIHEVKFPGDGDWTVLTSYVQHDSMELDELLMNESYRAAKDVYRFVIQDYTSAIHNKFYSANDVILFRALDGATEVFTGKIDPNFRQQISYLMRPLVLEAEDNSYLLDEPVQASFTYPALVAGAAYKIFDSGDTANSIIHLLLTAAGYNIATQIAEGDEAPADITTTIQHVAATAEEITHWEFIDDILHFHGFVFRWTADGKYTHVNWAPAVVVAAHTFLADLTAVKPLSITKKENDFDGVEVEWSLLDSISGARLYQDQSVPTDADGNFTGLGIAAGTFYPMNADVQDIF